MFHILHPPIILDNQHKYLYPSDTHILLTKQFCADVATSADFCRAKPRFFSVRFGLLNGLAVEPLSSGRCPTVWLNLSLPLGGDTNLKGEKQCGTLKN
jgi:hypothetical protein